MTDIAMKTAPSVSILEAFTDAWNRHDLDGLMSFMTDDCVFEAAGGPDECGARFEGQAAVREAFPKAWKTFPDAHWSNGKHFVFGNRGVSEWTFSGTAADGTRLVADGCDIFVFHGNKIALKNAFRKARTPVKG